MYDAPDGFAVATTEIELGDRIGDIGCPSTDTLEGDESRGATDPGEVARQSTLLLPLSREPPSVCARPRPTFVFALALAALAAVLGGAARGALTPGSGSTLLCRCKYTPTCTPPLPPVFFRTACVYTFHRLPAYHTVCECSRTFSLSMSSPQNSTPNRNGACPVYFCPWSTGVC